MSYLEELRALLPGVKETLSKRGIQARHLEFGGEGAKAARPVVPTDARSEFLANRAMGDWAESKLADRIALDLPSFKAVRYGDADRIAAGEKGFRDFYLRRVEGVRLFGKRPDLLVVPAGASVPADLSPLAIDEADKLVTLAVSSIEVRSSKFEAMRYMAARQEERACGKRGGRLCPSFTVKVEDLRIVYRWIERYGVPQAYVQVFFDSVFGLNVIDIFSMIARGENVTVENPKKSQEKTTLMIPITAGRRLGSFHSPPRFVAEERVTRLGRHDAYVRPEGGDLRLDPKILAEVLRLPR